MQIPNMGKSPLNEKIAKNQMSGNSNLNQNMMNVHGNMQNLNMSGSFSNKFYQNPENQINNPSLSKNELISTITVSLQNAINEILSQVVERAVNISLVTTRELVIKDFSFDPDDIKFKTATIMCMKSLAGSLATVTCKEPLRIGFINQFRDQLSKRGIEIDNEFFASISKINDILEIGSNFIQNYVVKRAIEKIEKDKTINEELEKRGKNKDTNLSPPETKDSSSNQNQFSSGFINSKIYNIYNTKLKNIPDVLKPSRNGLTPDQFKIYEDFENIIETDRKENSVPRLTLIKMIAPAIKEFLETDQNSNFINKFDLCLLNIQFLAKNSCDYFDEDENLLLLSKMISNSNVHYSDDDLKLLIPIAMKFIIHACRNNNLTLINLYTEVLRGLADLSAKINKAKEAEMNLFTEEDGKIISNNKLKFDFRSEITNCIFENNDVIATKMLYEIHVYLYKKSLLDNNLYATYIMENIKDPSLKNDTLKLLAFLKDRNIISMNPQLIENKLDDYNYIELFFNRNFEKGSLTSNESSPSKFILDSNSLSSYIILNNEQFVKYRDFVQSMFNKFITVCYHSNPEQLKLFVMSITEIYHRNKNELKALFLVLVENVIRNDLYYEEGNSVYSDTLPRLVLFLITYMNAKSSDILHLFLFSVGKMMVLDLARMRSNNHEGRGSAKNFKFKEFSAKPYFKILFNILYLISQINEKDENTMNSKNELLEEYGNFMLAFKPLNFPAFALAWLDILSSKCFEQVHNYKEKMFYFISEIVLFVKKLNSIELNFFEKSTFLDQVYKYFFLISHSNPQFLSACALMLVKMLPEGDENFTQLKNIILSAEPVDQELTINVEAEKQQDTNNSNSNDNITVDKKPSFKGVLLVDDIVDIHQVYPSFATDIESIIKENEEEAINEITSNISEYLKGLLEKEYKGYVETKNENSPDCNFDEVKNALWVLLSLLCSRINKISKSINKNLDREENKEELNHCKSLFTTYSKIVESVFSIINNITTSILPDQTEADKVRFLIISFYISSIINNIRFDSEVSRIFSSLIINLLQDNENSNDFKAFIEEQIVRSLILRLLYKPYPRAIVSLTIEVFDKVALFRKSFISSISNQVEELFKFVRSYKGKHDLDNYV